MWDTERIKRFWEACGFILLAKAEWEQGGIRYGGSLGRYVRCISPDGSRLARLPSITDLNALFKWAVPELKAWTLGSSYPDKKLTLCLVSIGNKGVEAESKDPAFALAEAIEKALIGE